MPETRLAVDFEKRTLSVRLANGQETTLPLQVSAFSEPVNLQRVEFDAEAGQLLVTMAGERAVAELRDPRRTIKELRAGRQIVYLDQNGWSTLAKARHGHRPVKSETERHAALKLAEMAEDRRILLPVSAGHHVETRRLHGSGRVPLAGTVLALSRGWRMRHPLHVRFEEMLGAMQAAAPTAADVFAPSVDEVFATRGWASVEPDPSDRGGPTGTPRQPEAAALEQMGRIVPAVLGLYDAVVDAEDVPVEGVARAAAENWAQAWAELAPTLRDAGEPASMVRRVAGANMLLDMLDDINHVAAAVGSTPSQVVERMYERDDPISRMPFLAQMRQILFARLRNVGQRWEPSHLVDLMFLCCAAGYADVVVGEGQTIEYLGQARQPRPRARLAVTLQEAVEVLEATGHPAP